MKKSEKLLLNENFTATKNVEKLQQDLSIGQLIFLIRKQLRISQRTLSKKSQIPQSTISRIEAGILNPTIKDFKTKFSQHFPVNWLLQPLPMKISKIFVKNKPIKKRKKFK